MRDRFLQYLAVAAIAVVFVLLVVVIGALSEGHTGPSGETPAGCAEDDRACNEWIDIQGPEEGR